MHVHTQCVSEKNEVLHDVDHFVKDLSAHLQRFLKYNIKQVYNEGNTKLFFLTFESICVCCVCT